MTTDSTLFRQSTQKYKIISKTLNTDETINIQMECGYCLVSNAVACISGGDGDDVIEGRIYELQNGGKPILSFRTKDGTIHKANDEINKYSFRVSLSDNFKEYLKAHEHPDDVCLILKQFNRKPEDIPPWTRKEPAREIDVINLRSAELSLNEDGNAIRFEEECKPYLIYAADKDRWYAWVVNHWEDAGEKLGISARFVSETLLNELTLWEKEFSELDMKIVSSPGSIAAYALKPRYTQIKHLLRKFQNHINSSKSDRGLKAMVNICAKSTMTTDFSKHSDVDLIVFKNGILDTKEGKLYSNIHADRFKEQYPVRYIDCSYMKGAVPKVFNWHLLTIFTDNTTPDLSEKERVRRRVAMGRYFKRWLGYLLISGNPEQIMLFLYGIGANGKSTTIDIIREILGDEIAEASIKELYSTSEDKPATGISEGLSKAGLMFSEASDSDDKTYGGRVSRDSIKALTGDKQTARFRRMRHGGVRQRVICKPFAVTNELPHFDKDIDSALLRRIVTLPFTHRFTKEERDTTILDKLLQEKDEIFTLIVNEAIAYRNGSSDEGMDSPGLMPVPEFCKITQADLLAGVQYSAFVDAVYQKSNEKTPRELINQEYIDWCDLNGFECDTIMKPSGIQDQYGYYLKVRCLTRNEQNKLYKAFRVKEFNYGNSSGKRYFCCSLKKREKSTSLKKDVL